MKTAFIILSFGAILSAIAASASTLDPAWWQSNTPTAILLENADENNFAPVSLGQLKHVAEMARQHLDEKLASIGGSSPHPFSPIAPMVNAFQTYEGIPIGENPNFSPINLGQLKAVAEPFYLRLIEIGYDTRQNLIDQGYEQEWQHPFPWADQDNPLGEANRAPANIGQLKMVFSFDLTGFDTSELDTDGDGIPDEWKWIHFEHLLFGPEFDFLGDGVTLLQAYHLGLDPTESSTEDDGLPDWWKVGHFAEFDENLEQWVWLTGQRGPNDDPDGDELTNLQEFEIGTDPTDPDTDGDGMPDGWEVANNLDPLDNGSGNFMLGPDGDASLDGLTNLENYLMNLDPHQVYQHQAPVLDPPGGAHSANTLAITIDNPNPVSNTAWERSERLGFVTYTTDGRDPTSADPQFDPENPVIIQGRGVHIVKARVFTVGSGPGEVATGTYFLGGIPQTPASTVYYGIKSDPFTPPTISDLTYSYSSSGFDSNLRAVLGSGWIVDDSFKPDLSASPDSIYYRRFEYTPNVAINVYSRTEAGFGPSLSMGSGWITSPTSMKPDFNALPGPVYYGYKPGMGNQTFVHTKRKNDIVFDDRVEMSPGWITGVGGFIPSQSSSSEIWAGQKAFSNGQVERPVYSTVKTDIADAWSVGDGWIHNRSSFKTNVKQASRTVYRGTKPFISTDVYAYNPADLDGPVTEVGDGWIQNISVILDTPHFRADDDDDGLINGYETFLYGTDPNNADTSGDFLSDSEKAAYWALHGNGNPDHPYHPKNFLDPYADTDGDGLTNIQEFVYGSSPLSGNDRPALIQGFLNVNPFTETTLFLTLGDHSGSRSEIWRMVVEEIDPTTGARSNHFSMLSPGFGIVSERIPVPGFRRGYSYAFRLQHVRSNCDSPDYDYTMKVEPPPGVPHIFEDPDSLLGVFDDSGGCGAPPSGDFLAEGYEAKLHLLKFELTAEKGNFNWTGLSALTEWNGQDEELAKTKIMVSISPDNLPAAEKGEVLDMLKLKVKELHQDNPGGRHYQPIGRGTFQRNEANQAEWTYTAFGEPTIHHPQKMLVTIVAEYGGQTTPDIATIHVRTFFDRLTGIQSDFGDPAVANLETAYAFIRWKYADYLDNVPAIDRTSTGFNSFTVKNVNHPTEPDTRAETSIFDNVIFWYQSFQNENTFASTVAHELYHTGQSVSKRSFDNSLAECEAYDYQVLTMGSCGADIFGDYVDDIRTQWSCICWSDCP